MEWVLSSPQIHNTFGNLGFANSDGYHINENCNAALETILQNILTEDKYLRTYRRSISFGQNINKDLIPLLLHAKESKTIEILVKILVNLTIPIECLLSVEVISKTDFGRHTIFDINNLLSTTKSAFSDQRVTKVTIEFLKENMGIKQKVLTEGQCMNISNSLLLLRNILHIPEVAKTPPGFSLHTIQNHIIWNIFSQNVDKILLKLMAVPEALNWGVTMVQLIALLYKDQHVVTLHKLINIWLEKTLSESSEDNESNTSPPDRGSEDSSPMLNSDPTSDSSDTGGSGKSGDEPNSEHNEWNTSQVSKTNEHSPPSELQQPAQKLKQEQKDNSIGTSLDLVSMKSHDKSQSFEDNGLRPQKKTTKNEKTVISETSDCGYGTQIENQESNSTSSNEDESPSLKPVHQKPHNPKQRVNTKVRTATITLQTEDKKRKKLVKRGKANPLNVQGLSHKTPTDEDIANIFKEFTVDFLLKGYNHLVQTLHTQIITNLQLEIDISHFFWLMTYFLKFATQIELDLELVGSVLSFDIISYMTAEGVNLCEQFELATKLEGSELRPNIRRLHLVVTAIREFVQAIDMYKKFAHICDKDQEALITLQVKMCETMEIRSLLLLLLRHYKPKYHTKQYLQDLIVTNHILLIFLDSVMKLPGYTGSGNMIDHIKQFATPKIMYQYGLLLEDYNTNGEFVNDCIFTMMHHVGGELGCVDSLYQPKILKTFTSIWRSEFEICDDWSDLIEYVINTFVKKPDSLHMPNNFSKPLALMQTEPEDQEADIEGQDRWTEDELSSLSWNYIQCSALPDVVGEIIKLFKEVGVTKSRDSVINELYKQNLINKDEHEVATRSESERNFQATSKTSDDEINKLCEQLKQEGKSKYLGWVQQVLLEVCYAKLNLEKKSAECSENLYKEEIKLLTFEFFKEKATNFPVVSPVAYHSFVYNQSVPLVQWNCEQAAMCSDPQFLKLLHKLRFHMPLDTGKVFVRIPHFWSADHLYEIASKLGPVDIAKLKFSLNDLTSKKSSDVSEEDSFMASVPVLAKDTLYQIHKQTHVTVNFMPKPAPSFNPETVMKQNWLTLVKKSQECKMTLDTLLKSAAAAMGEGKERSASPPVQNTSTGETKDPPYTEPLPGPNEADFNDSSFETASVASDLTRMYVSDEDDKSDVDEGLMPPDELEARAHEHPAEDMPLTETQEAGNDSDMTEKQEAGNDSDMIEKQEAGNDSDMIAEKRPRVE